MCRTESTQVRHQVPRRSFPAPRPPTRQECRSGQIYVPRGPFHPIPLCPQISPHAPQMPVRSPAGSVRSPSTGFGALCRAVSATVRFGLRNSLTRMGNPASMAETDESGSELVRCGSSQVGARKNFLAFLRLFAPNRPPWLVLLIRRSLVRAQVGEPRFREKARASGLFLFRKCRSFPRKGSAALTPKNPGSFFRFAAPQSLQLNSPCPIAYLGRVSRSHGGL
jgi:hypothetical protein